MTFKFKFGHALPELKIPKLTGGTIWVLEILFGVDSLTNKLNNLRSSPVGTVGRAVANLLDEKRYRLIPRFENHDLKHIVLDYDMTMHDEIKMQAYLVGNGKIYQNTSDKAKFHAQFTI